MLPSIETVVKSVRFTASPWEEDQSKAISKQAGPRESSRYTAMAYESCYMSLQSTFYVNSNTESVYANSKECTLSI